MEFPFLISASNVTKISAVAFAFEIAYFIVCSLPCWNEGISED